MLLIAYHRSEGAGRGGYRGSRPFETVSVRGVRTDRCNELERLLLRRPEVGKLLPGSRGGSKPRAGLTPGDQHRGAS